MNYFHSFKLQKNVFSALFLVFFLTSCASYNYNNSSNDRKINIKSDNLPDFQVIDVKTSNKLTTASAGSASTTLITLKNKETKLLLSHPNYDPITIDIKRSPRPKALVKDIGLGIFTFGIPIVIDAFKSDFYQVSSSTKEFDFHFEFKQSYMSDEFAKISNSKNPEDFKTWISKYPKSVHINEATDRKDSLELNIALSKETELSIDDFIASHTSSNYLEQAQKIKTEMVSARELFESTKKENSVAAYERFLSTYPRSIHNTDAHRRLIDAAEKVATGSSNSSKMIDYIKLYIAPNSAYLSNAELEVKKTTISKAIDGQLIKEHIKTDAKKNYDYYSNLWKAYNNLREQNIDNYLMPLEQTLSYQSKISNLLFTKVSEANTQEKQTQLIAKINSDFPSLDPYDTNRNPIFTILENANLSNGNVKLYNIGFLPQYFENMSERNALIGRAYYNYKGSDYQALTGITFEEISFVKGQLNGISKCYKGSELDYLLNMSSTGPKEISYYQNGKLVKTTTFLPNYEEYSYEFENGVNLTLQELTNKINELNTALSAGNFDKVISECEIALKNNYPSNLTQNVNLKKCLTNAKSQKEVYLKKQEELRLIELKAKEAEENRLKSLYYQNVCISGNFVCNEEEELSTSRGRYDFMLFNSNGTLKLGNSNGQGRDIKYNGYGWYEIRNDKVYIKDNYDDEYYFEIYDSRVEIDEKCRRIYTLRKQDLINYKGVNKGGQLYYNVN